MVENSEESSESCDEVRLYRFGRRYLGFNLFFGLDDCHHFQVSGFQHLRRHILTLDAIGELEIQLLMLRFHVQVFGRKPESLRSVSEAVNYKMPRRMNVWYSVVAG